MTRDADADVPQVPIHCSECETTTRVPLPEVADTLARHNEQLHDGDGVAVVDPEVTNQLADLIADDLGLTDDVE